MKNVVSIIHHKGKEIVYINYSGLSSLRAAEFIEAIQYAADFMISRGQNQLTLTDASNAFGNSEIVKALKEVSVRTKPFRRKAAVIGIAGTKSIILNAVNIFSGSNLKSFSNMEEAKDWLVDND